MNKTTKTKLIGASLAAALLPALSQAGNPFAATPLPQGYDMANFEKAEGKCGEGKCGKEEPKESGEGKCGEGKCGEGKCGGES